MLSLSKIFFLSSVSWKKQISINWNYLSNPISKPRSIMNSTFLIKLLIQGNRTCHWSGGQCHVCEVTTMLSARISDTLSPLQPLCLLPHSQMPLQFVCTADTDNCNIVSMDSSNSLIKLSRHYKSSHCSCVFHGNTQVIYHRVHGLQKIMYFSHEEVFCGACFACRKLHILKLKGHFWEAMGLHVIAKSPSEQQWLTAIYKFNGNSLFVWDC